MCTEQKSKLFFDSPAREERIFIYVCFNFLSFPPPPPQDTAGFPSLLLLPQSDKNRRRSTVRASKPNLFSLAFSFPVYIFNFLPFPPRSVFPYQPPLIASKGKKAKIFFFPGHPATGFPCLFSQLLALKQKDICILGTKNWENNNLQMQMINRYTVFSAISGPGSDFLINYCVEQ